MRSPDKHIADHRLILSSGVPLIDVRAPTEFARGAFPGAVNLPLLDDEQRAAVGKCYRSDGQQAAIALGEKLVSGDLREQRLAAWCDAASHGPDSLLYCWRGGLRSQTVQRWLDESRVSVALIEGGYKALRATCLTIIDEFADQAPLLVLGGRTGSGKTELLNSLPRSLDLEGLANHRGSAFGANRTPQPTPINFENALAVYLLKLNRDAPVVIEDEGRTIGRLAVPERLHDAMQRAPLIIMEVELAQRGARIWREYVDEPLLAGSDPAKLAAGYLASSDRIKRRLGGLRHTEVRRLMSAAFATDNDKHAHQLWIEALLSGYYDPMYDYQLANKEARIAFSGDRDAVRDYLRRQTYHEQAPLDSRRPGR
jgi:tRNA 2-selenouridine synthase